MIETCWCNGASKLQTVKLLNLAKPNTPKEIVLRTCHRKLIKPGVDIETQFSNVT